MSWSDASYLGIHPPATVRIDMDGWVQDWPFEQVIILRDRVAVSKGGEWTPKADTIPADGTMVYYPFTSFGPCCVAHATGRIYPPIRHSPHFVFFGPTPFIVCAGPPQEPSTNGNGHAPPQT